MSGERLLIHGDAAVIATFDRALSADTYARGDHYGELAVIPQLKPSASNAHDRHFVDPCHTKANPLSESPSRL